MLAAGLAGSCQHLHRGHWQTPQMRVSSSPRMRFNCPSFSWTSCSVRTVGPWGEAALDSMFVSSPE